MASLESEAARIFLETVEAHERDQWAEFVRAATAGNPVLLERVDALLKAHDESNPMLDAERHLATADIPTPSERPGTLIGPYKLLEQIGEGGFGVVFMAEQQQPVRRKVALKIIKPGMDNPPGHRPLRSRAAGAGADGSSQYCQILDAGTTGQRRQETGDRKQEAGASKHGAGDSILSPDSCLLSPDLGRPYFVMELVRGVPITDYCDENRLSPRQRLELFVSVCQAVQHAHQKGIIHRDLKPTNVLVTLHDGTPVVKVIDFGIAKALGRPLTDKTLVTGFAQMIGTPLYISPEQAELSGLDMDTRSDIYSLGVVLYELLTGTTPFEKERLHAADYDEMRRIIREEEPARPSARISTLGQAAATVSSNRQSDPQRLGNVVRGELDWIVMQLPGKGPQSPLCDGHRPGQRYHSVSERRTRGRLPAVAGVPAAEVRAAAPSRDAARGGSGRAPSRRGRRHDGGHGRYPWGTTGNQEGIARREPCQPGASRIAPARTDTAGIPCASPWHGSIG